MSQFTGLARLFTGKLKKKLTQAGSWDPTAGVTLRGSAEPCGGPILFPREETLAVLNGLDHCVTE